MKKVYLFLLLCVCIQLSWGQDRATEIRNTFLSGNTSLLLVVAHRADWRNAPENSLQGIQNCRVIAGYTTLVTIFSFEKQAEIVSLQNITSIRDFGDYCSVDP